MKIAFLCDHPQHWETVADWMFDEFCVVDRPCVTRTMMLEKIKTRKRAFPYTFVALIGDVCVGTITLYDNDLKGESATPWLGSLVVAPAWRGRGIARVLMAYLEGFARARGYSTLYLRTEHTAGYYERLGWRFVKETIDPVYDLPTRVYQKGV